MNITVKSIGAWTLVAPQEKRLDASISEEFRAVLFEQVSNGNGKIVLDLASVEFMDSSGLGAIVKCLQKVESKDSLALSGVQESVSVLLRLTHLDKVFRVLDTPEDVLDGSD